MVDLEWINTSFERTTPTRWAHNTVQRESCVISGSHIGLVVPWRKDEYALEDCRFIAAIHRDWPAIIAELRAARECARVLRCAYEVDAIKDWFDDVPGGAGGKASLEAYNKATKGER